MKKERKVTEPDASKYPKGFSEYGGLTKREYFAALFMQAHIEANLKLQLDGAAEELAEGAICAADALIEALNAQAVEAE